ncbi:T9SS type A sorting domain-containing protein [Flavobacteriales bacterium]|nr:T9SS type A sorting domain-containing protein [Flavobacteriales bacterium]
MANTGDMTFTSNDFYYIVSNACGADTASVEVSTFQPANTGTPVSPFEVCNWGNIYLYDGLSGTIDFGGDWNDDTGTGVLTGASLQVSALNAGSYQFTYTASNGVCADATTTITVDLIDCTGVEEAVANNFSVYPNPSTGLFTIELQGGVSNVKLSILDLNGRIVYSQPLIKNKTNVDLNTIANGVYTVVLVSDDTVSSTKMIVAK